METFRWQRVGGVVAVLLAACAGAVRVQAHGDVHERITNLTAQIQLAPSNAALYMERGELHRVHREFAAALADFDRVAQLDPQVRMVDFCRGRTWMEAGDLQQALLPLDRYLAGTTNDAQAWATRARVHAELQHTAPAVADFTRALALAPTGQPEWYLERAQVLSRAGATEEALRGIDEGIARLGPLITLQLQAIELETALKRHDRALKRLDGVMARTPRKESWLVRRAEILRQAGRAEESRAAYREALAALEKLPSTHRNTRAMSQLEASIRSALREDAAKVKN